MAKQEPSLAAPEKGKLNVLAEAQIAIVGPRRESYGPVERSFARVATLWSMRLGKDVSPEDVAWCMMAMKLVREANKPHRDNLVDICGYAALSEQLQTQKSKA